MNKNKPPKPWPPARPSGTLQVEPRWLTQEEVVELRRKAKQTSAHAQKVYYADLRIARR
jgi:hypothetical protein